jgi:hypothetical protein
MSAITSRSSGKRPASFLEKIRSPSAKTSNWPVAPGVVSASNPVCSVIAAARLVARRS